MYKQTSFRKCLRSAGLVRDSFKKPTSVTTQSEGENELVLDASALLAYLNTEPGADAVEEALGTGVELSPVSVGGQRGYEEPDGERQALHSSPHSRTFYDRKRREGKRHTQALIALARRRVNVVWAMLRDGTTFEARSAA
jgi:hypothetical protein